MEESINIGTGIEMVDTICEGMGIKKVDVRSLSPLVLAYIGDAVYEILVRTKIISESGAQVNKLHRMSTMLVKAHAQAEIVKLLELTEEENRIYKRGRNAKSVTMAKNATMTDYRRATGFEALIGYLYMSGQTSRMLELVSDGIEKYQRAERTIK